MQPEDNTARPAERIDQVRPIVLSGETDAGTDLVGAVVVDDFLILGADEGHQLQVLKRAEAPGTWHLQQKLALAGQGRVTDIGAMGFGRGHLYIVCSHACQRRRVCPEFTVRKNRQRLAQVDLESSRNRLYRMSFDPKSGKIGKVRFVDLSKRLRKDRFLKPFFGVPSRENGIEFGGMTFAGGRLHLGFRGPILRDNHVPVMVLDYEQPKDHALLFVRLDGQAIRDLAALKHGFLILSCPANDAPGAYCLWWWDGADQVAGKGRKVREAVLLGAVSTPGGARAMGLALRRQTDSYADVILVYETETAAQVVSMRVQLPD